MAQGFSQTLPTDNKGKVISSLRGKGISKFGTDWGLGGAKKIFMRKDTTLKYVKICIHTLFATLTSRKEAWVGEFKRRKKFSAVSEISAFDSLRN